MHIGNEGHLEWLCDGESARRASSSVAGERWKLIENRSMGIVPWGFGKLLAYINEKYMLPNDIPLIVTEQVSRHPSSLPRAKHPS